MAYTSHKQIQNCSEYRTKIELNKNIEDCKGCSFLDETKECCTILRITNGKNCSFRKEKKKLAKEQKENEINLEVRFRKIYEQPNGKARLKSILDKHPDLKTMFSDLLPDIEDYERRYHFKYDNPKVFTMSDKW